jgi:hypothetical protein
MGLGFAVVWLLLFFLRKDNRAQMLFISALGALAGPFFDILYTQDWWMPANITSTKIGYIEGALTGFMIAGVATVIYEDIFRERIILKKGNKKELIEDFHLLLLTLFTIVASLSAFFILHINSLLSTLFAFGVPVLLIYYSRRDLIKASLLTSLLLVVIAAGVYTVINFFTPGWIIKFWYFKNVPNIIVLNLPLDDLLWYLFAGAYLGPLYEYWREGKFTKFKR